MGNSQTSWSFLNTSVERSFAWSLTLTALPVAASFIVSWAIARWAGPSVMGMVAWVMAFATFVLIVGKFGLDLGSSRLASEYGVNRPGALRLLFRTGIGLRLFFTLGVAALSFALAEQIAHWFKDPQLANPVRIGAGVMVCASLYEFKEQFLIGLNRHAVVAKVRSITQLTRVVLTLVIVLSGLGAVTILAGYVAAWFVGIVIFIVLLFRHLPPALEADSGDLGLVRRLLWLSAPLAISSASVTIYSQTDKLMLGYFGGLTEVGQYAVARNVTEVSLFPVFAFAMTMRPALASRYSSGALEECAALIRKALRFSLISGVLFASVFAVMSVPLLTMVFSKSFRPAGELMAVFIWVIVLRSLGSLVLPALVAAERTKLYAALTLFTAGINFLLNLALIPSLQARGAVLATIVSYAFLLFIGLYHVFKIYGIRLSRRALSLAFRTVLAGVVAGALLWLVLGRNAGETVSPTVFLWGALQAIIYAFLILLLRVVSLNDLKATFGNLRKMKG